jgi:hypothetical protein
MFEERNNLLVKAIEWNSVRIISEIVNNIKKSLKLVCEDYSDYQNTKYEKLNIIREVRNDLVDEIYKEDEDDPQLDIWKCVLVVPWWRISFKYKMFKIDEEEKKKKELMKEK